MKGFGIEIKNTLLDPKHVAAMGISVWLYMWLLDHMTSISEEGIGKVLGGKPIKFEEVGEELGVSMRTYRRWVEALKKGGYINIITAPYGLVISVNKAHKRFGNRSAISGTPDVPQTAHLSTKSGTPNKTEQKTEQEDHTGPQSDPAIPLVIDLFKEVNPSYRNFFARQPQRKAVSRLLGIHGFEHLSRVIKILPQSNRIAYLPTITTPIQLEEKWASLESGLVKKKEALTASGRGLA